MKAEPCRCKAPLRFRSGSIPPDNAIREALRSTSRISGIRPPRSRESALRAFGVGRFIHSSRSRFRQNTGFSGACEKIEKNDGLRIITRSSPYAIDLFRSGTFHFRTRPDFPASKTNNQFKQQGSNGLRCSISGFLFYICNSIRTHE